jgi:hypothetical protein
MCASIEPLSPHLRPDFIDPSAHTWTLNLLCLCCTPQYGNGWTGGANDQGTIFRFDPVSSNLTAVFSYTQATGAQPYNSLGESLSGEWLYSVTW